MLLIKYLLYLSSGLLSVPIILARGRVKLLPLKVKLHFRNDVPKILGEKKNLSLASIIWFLRLWLLNPTLANSLT